MAYMKYKELTKYFNFNKELDIDELENPKFKYVKDYLGKGESVYSFYKTRHDKAIFTDSRMILFDVTPITHHKKIHILPYSHISSGAVSFTKISGAILLSMDSGYQVRLNFVNLDAKAKTNLRLLYSFIMDYQRKK